MRSLLIVEDDDSLRRVLEIRLKSFQLNIHTAKDGAEGLLTYKKEQPDIVLTDIKMPHMDGFELIEKLKKENQDIIILVMTAFSDVNTAIKAMKLGASDFIPKPFDKDYLKHVINKALETLKLKTEVETLKKIKNKPEKDIIYQSQSMQAILNLSDEVAQSDASVLITGESGVGKELMAWRIHYKSQRKDHKFIAVNCAAIPESLIESELFGHVKGAFTGADKNKKGKFELANHGTIFLDEIGEMPLELQGRLLRVLQERQVVPIGSNAPIDLDIRILSATNKNLLEEIENKNFRDDLFYRLNVFPLHIPSLKERKEDIPALIQFFLKKYQSTSLDLSEASLDYLKNYHWPGNIRELENIAQRIAILSKSQTALKLPFIQMILHYQAQNNAFELPEDAFDLQAFEVDIIRRALLKHKNNKTQTAKYLKLPRHVLIYKMEKYDI